jgi:photosystem II stability/assembly factor-like uncharacterized protein
MLKSLPTLALVSWFLGAHIMKTYWLSPSLILSLVILSLLTLAGAAPALTPAAAAAETIHHVAGRSPVQGPGYEMSADRPASPGTAHTAGSVRPNANAWTLLATLPGAVIHDISFPTTKVGYAAAELGQVWKTTDGGAHWREIVNLGFPYYWFGVHALTAQDVVISGFNDSNFEGILRWSHDGGASWTPDIVLTTSGWSYRVRFANSQDGLVMDGLNLNAANAAHYTTVGGESGSEWIAVVPDANGGWFGNQFSLLPNLHVRTSGITYCASPDGGVTWRCRKSIDSVFDGPVFFVNDHSGWVGGGEISPSVEGWVHTTTDGGKTWSGRTLDGPWPIRELRFLTPLMGWAAGGNVYSNAGGMYFSTDGGQTWSLDVDTGAEMDACDSRRKGRNFQVWCAGYNGSLQGVVYTLRGKVQ